MIRAEPSHEGFSVSFADGLVSFVPWDSIEETHDQLSVDAIEISAPGELQVRTRDGRIIEIPRDFVRRFGDAEYRERVSEETLRGQRVFAARLRKLRRKADLSQQRLADLSGVGRVTISRIEAAAQSPKLATIQKLASAMGYPVQASMMDDWADFALDGEPRP